MFHHLAHSFRNLRRNAFYSTINIIGLSVSLAAVILIMLWVNDELSFDKFHKRSSDIHLSVASFNTGDREEYWPLSSPPILTVGWQAIKAETANPVKAIQSE